MSPVAVRERTGPTCVTCPAELLLIRPGRAQCERCRLDGIAAPVPVAASGGVAAARPAHHDPCVRCGRPVHRLLATDGRCRDCVLIHVFGTLHPGRPDDPARPIPRRGVSTRAPQPPPEGHRAREGGSGRL